MIDLAFPPLCSCHVCTFWKTWGTESGLIELCRWWVHGRGWLEQSDSRKAFGDSPGSYCSSPLTHTLSSVLQPRSPPLTLCLHCPGSWSRAGPPAASFLPFLGRKPIWVGGTPDRGGGLVTTLLPEVSQSLCPHPSPGNLGHSGR